MKLELKKMKVLGVVLLGALGLSSCLDGNDDVPVIQDAAFVAFINASPDSNGLRFYSNDRLINQTATPYSQFFGYVNFEVGAHQIKVNSGSNTDLDTISVTLAKDRRYSIFAVNKFADLELVPYEDNLITPETGKSVIRFIQLSPDAPNLKVAVEGVAAPIGNFSFKQASSFSQINELVNKKIYLIDSETQDTLLTKQINLQNGKIYSIFSKGLVNTTVDSQKLDVQIIPVN